MMAEMEYQWTQESAVKQYSIVHTA